jgi:hypothetical protein
MSLKLREDWLNRVAEALAPWFAERNYPLPRYRISCGFPSTGKKGSRIGECWANACSGDETHEIFIHPKLADGIEVSATLAHELIHAAVGLSHKHGGEFKRIALEIGLEGKMRSTHAGEAFKQVASLIIENLGPYPHATLDTEGASSKEPKQGTRMIKIKCPDCGWTGRTTRQWIDLGLPTCACGGEIAEAK